MNAPALPSNAARLFDWLQGHRFGTIGQISICLDLHREDVEAGLEYLVRNGLAFVRNGRHPNTLQPVKVYSLGTCQPTSTFTQRKS